MQPVIIAAPSVPGETVPLLRLAHGLVERGHPVTVLAGSIFAEQAAATGARFVPLRGKADLTAEGMAAFLAGRAGIAPGPDQLRYDFHGFVEPVPDQHEAVQELLRETPDSVLVTNALFLGPWAVALGVPGLRPRRWIAVGVMPLVEASADTTPFGPIPGLSGAERAAAHAGVNAGFAAVVEPQRQHLQSMVADLGGSGEVPAFNDGFVAMSDVFAQLSVAEFDFPRSDAPDNLRYVGLLPARAPSGWQAPPWWDELDGDRPVVVVTQGTLLNGDLGELVGPTLSALADQDVLVVAALGRELADGELDVPANARVSAFLPFDQLLPKADLLVTNGGSGGTQQALAAGVPVVVAGVTEDKPMTAARVVAHGLGVDLATSTPSVAQVRDAVAAVLHDPSVRSAVAHLAQAYRAHDAVDLIAAMVQAPAGAAA